MKSLEHTLQRLLKAAGRAGASRAVPEHPPFALETAVIHLWRTSAVEDDWASVADVFRRAVVCSGLVMTLIAGWSWFQARTPEAGASELAAYAMTIQLPP